MFDSMKSCAVAAVLVFAPFGAVAGTDGTWTNLTAGVWSDATQWADGVAAGGAGASVHIAPGFGGARREDRTLEIPAEGVTVGSVNYETGDPLGAIRIWGGPLMFDAGDETANLFGSTTPDVLNLLSGVRGNGDLHVGCVTLAAPCHYTGDTYLDFSALNLFMVSSAESPSSAATNHLPATRLTMAPNTSVYMVSRGSGSAYQATFTLTEGSSVVTATVDVNKCVGAPISGDGIPEGTFVKSSVTEYMLQLSQPATKSGESLLSVGGIPSGLTSLQQFTNLTVQGKATLDLVSHQNSILRWEVGELTGTGLLSKRGNGTLAMGMGTNFVGTLDLYAGRTEISAHEDVQPRFAGLQCETAELRVPESSTVVSVDTFSSTGTLYKTGAGTLAFKAMSGMPMERMEVSEGRVEIGDEDGLRIRNPVPGAWFQVDASDPSTLSTVCENGTNFVTRWNDCAGGAVYAGVGASGQDAVRPFVSTNFLNGKPVVDFGSYLYRERPNNQSEYTVYMAGHGGSLVWSTRDTSLREVFLVCADTDDIQHLDTENRAANFLVGDASSYAFHRGLGTALFHTYANSNVRSGVIEVDGESCGIDYELQPGFHLIHLRTTGGVAAGAFARNRDLGYGGQRIAEAIFYNSPLSDEQAGLVADYLRRKWFGGGQKAVENLVLTGDADITVDAGDVFHVGTLKLDGEVRKCGAGTLRAGSVVTSGQGELRVVEGRFESGDGNAVALEEVVMGMTSELGADACSTLAVTRVVGAGGTLAKDGAGRVEVGGLDRSYTSLDVRDGTLALPNGALPSGSWFHVDASDASTLTLDVRDGRKYVRQWRDASGGSVVANAGSTPPYLSEDRLGGRPVVDFGGFRYSSKSINGYGGFLDWSATDSEIREIFLVYADSEDIADLPSDPTANFFLGHTGDKFNFHRGADRRLFYPTYSSSCLRDGLIEVDGLSREYTFELPAGFHLLHFRTTGNVLANTFARDRGIAFGGELIAEAVIYNRVLTDEEAASATAHLLAKWWGTGPLRAFDGVSVASGATLDMAGTDVTVTNLACAGTIRATTLAPCTLTLVSDGEGVASFTLEGQFDAGTPGVVMLTGEMLPKRSNAVFPVAEVSGVLDAPMLSRWKVQGEALPSGWLGHLALRDGRLALVLTPGATTLFVR